MCPDGHCGSTRLPGLIMKHYRNRRKTNPVERLLGATGNISIYKTCYLYTLLSMRQVTLFKTKQCGMKTCIATRLCDTIATKSVICCIEFNYQHFAITKICILQYYNLHTELYSKISETLVTLLNMFPVYTYSTRTIAHHFNVSKPSLYQLQPPLGQPLA